MKKYLVVTAVSCSIAFMAAVPARAQFIEDALRLSQVGPGVGARSLSMGSASLGLADDFSATYSNPAGLAQSGLNELNFGMSTLGYDNSASFYGNTQSMSNNSTELNSVGMMWSVPTTRGHLSFSLGYGRQADFNSALSFAGFNPKSSIIQSWAPDNTSYLNQDLSTNIAYQLYLANIDTLTGRFVSPIKNNVTQSGTVLEGGGLNYWSGAGSIEAARNLYLGMSLDFISGSYTLTRNYYEDDLGNVWNSYPFDFTSLSLTDAVESDISGFTMKFGFLYKFEGGSSLGITIKTPSWTTVHEHFSERATSLFDNGDQFQYPGADFHYDNEYQVHTPFVFSAGLAHAFENLTLAADVEYADWTQTEFSTDALGSSFDSYLQGLNTSMKSQLQGTANVRAGAEYTLPGDAFTIRGGAKYLPSPYTMDNSDNAEKYVTGGIGFAIERALLIDIAYARGWWKTSHINYDAKDASGQQLSQTQESIETNTIVGTISYRF